MQNSRALCLKILKIVYMRGKSLKFNKQILVDDFVFAYKLVHGFHLCKAR